MYSTFSLPFPPPPPSDLDLSALRAIGLVMSGLVLQSKFKTSDVIEEKGKLFLKYVNNNQVPLSITPSSPSFPISSFSPPPPSHPFPSPSSLHPFPRYFKSFMNLIHSLNQVQWSTLSPIHKQPLLRHCASLQEYTIQAMSNMLTANIDSGLIHAIGGVGGGREEGD